jgi:histidine ammonia-lyase
MNNPEKTYDWQQPYTAAIWETDNLLVEGRIREALSAVEERRLSPLQVGSDEGHALAEADAGIQSLITERAEKPV